MKAGQMSEGERGQGAKMSKAFMCSGCDHVWVALLSHYKALALPKIAHCKHILASLIYSISLLFWFLCIVGKR